MGCCLTVGLRSNYQAGDALIDPVNCYTNLTKKDARIRMTAFLLREGSTEIENPRIVLLGRATFFFSLFPSSRSARLDVGKV